MGLGAQASTLDLGKWEVSLLNPYTGQAHPYRQKDGYGNVVCEVGDHGLTSFSTFII